MEPSTVRRVYRFRLEPTSEQEQRLRQFAGARRFIWNWALEQRRQHYRQTGKALPAAELSARLTALKDQPETAWLREMDAQLLQQALADVQRAFVNYFARMPPSTSETRGCAYSPWDTRLSRSDHACGGVVSPPTVACPSEPRIPRL
jgi:putative transposase